MPYIITMIIVKLVDGSLKQHLFGMSFHVESSYFDLTDTDFTKVHVVSLFQWLHVWIATGRFRGESKERLGVGATLFAHFLFYHFF